MLIIRSHEDDMHLASRGSTRDFDAASPRHSNVEKGNLWAEFAQGLQSGKSILAHSGDVEFGPVLMQQANEFRALVGFIFSNDRFHAVGMRRGTMISATVPPSREAATFSHASLP